MNKPYISAILAITSIAFSSGTIGQIMSRSEYKSAKKNIVNDYKSDKEKCGVFADNAKGICLAVAKSKEKVAKAELVARYKHSNNAA